MSYTTIAYVREILGRCSGFLQEDVPDGRVQDAIDSADGLINGYAAGTYMIPLMQGGVPVTGDKLLESLSSALAAYDVVLTVQGSQAIEQGDPVALRHTQAMNILQSVSTKKISWPFDTAAEENLPADITVVGQYQGDLFGPSDFEIRSTRPEQGSWFRGRGPYGSGTW